MSGPRLVLAGAAVGNGNRGVEALGRSVADAVNRDAPGSLLSILDDGWGVRHDASGRYPDVDIEFVGVRQSRRWHRPESWAQIRMAQTIGPRLNQVAHRLSRADAVLDLSAGDSFTDLYGPVRLKTVTAPKQAALKAGRPLILLPQTYGPFRTPEGRRLAERIVRSATLAYARDPWSFERLLELAGPDIDPAKLRSGVDVAFALDPRQPSADVVDALRRLHDRPVAGVNVSGLLLDPNARQRFSLAGDYLTTMTELVQKLIDTGAHVVLVPHVHAARGAGESDINAIDAVRERLEIDERSLTTVLPPDLDAAEVKWCIAQTDWFVGSRMHSTIAALSTLTPAAAYAYSDKTKGVFETCGVVDEVVDARTWARGDATQKLLASYHDRDRIKSQLARHVPATTVAARSQLREVLDTVIEHRPVTTPGGPRQ